MTRNRNRVVSGKPKRPSPAPYDRARRDRGAETRARLTEAGLDVFGRLGFEGASTRQIAKEADANLAAITYHFGSKEALHLAVARHVAECILSAMAPALAEAGRTDIELTRETARKLLRGLIERQIDVLLGSAEAERWARFLVREQMQPTAAFDVIFNFMGGAHATGTKLVGKLFGKAPEDPDVKLRVFTIIGQVLMFRVAQALVLRRMGWQSIGERERAEIKRVVLRNIEAILSAGET